MQVSQPVGRDAASRKYDILSAMMAYGLAQDKHGQRLVLRVMALITTRYNWQRNELSMGQREIARLWSVDERTVKRDFAKLRSQGWLDLKRAGARGRVAVYGLDLARILHDTKACWPHIGPDFVDRMSSTHKVPDAGNVVPLRPVASAAPVQDGSIWAQVQGVLQRSDPASYAMWFAGLSEAQAGQGVLSLIAPSKFHASYVSTNLAERIRVALFSVDPSLRVIKIDAR